MRVPAVAILTAVLIITGCGNKNDILASYDGGVITVNDLRSWLEERSVTDDKAVYEGDTLKKRLRQIALERLQIQYAKQEGFDLRGEFREHLPFAEGAYLAAFYRKRLRAGIEYSVETVKTSIIRLKIETAAEGTNSIPDTAKKHGNVLQDKMSLARSLIISINNGAGFEETAKKHSDDSSKNSGGEIGYVIDGIHNPELIKAALRLNPGEMTREPLLISGSLYIIKVFDHAILTPGNIEKLIHDKSQAGRISRHLKLNAVRELESRLSAQPDVVNNIGKVSLLRKDSVLFRIGASAFTAGAFDKELNFSESNRKAAGLNFKTPDLNRKAFILNKLFRDKLLEREARRLGIDKDKQFIKEWRALQDSALISFFRNKQITRSSELSTGLNADKTGKNRETFNRVKRIEAIHKWEQDLLQRNHFVVL